MVKGARETHDPEPVWDKEIAVAEKWIQFVDNAVTKSKSFWVKWLMPECIYLSNCSVLLIIR